MPLNPPQYPRSVPDVHCHPTLADPLNLEELVGMYPGQIGLTVRLKLNSLELHLYDPKEDNPNYNERPLIWLRTKSIHLGLITDDAQYRNKTLIQRLLVDPNFGKISRRASIYPSAISISESRLASSDFDSRGQNSLTSLTEIDNSKILHTGNSIKGILRTKSLPSLSEVIEHQPTKLESFRGKLNIPQPGLPVRKPLTDTLQTLGYIRNNMGLKSALTAIGKSEIGLFQKKI
ncbi:DgyrCDS6809 [Dimorphilus gyrociliatus]|uniref:DgyrCDS6809 n=1 Tax=Dimorphilus gyrociliatus TaxID=2664684 RepID=A0A7I8VP53_9ANNE|nr:DgyrCDS6809 [Dimorphilus gyrociliatus]